MRRQIRACAIITMGSGHPFMVAEYLDDQVGQPDITLTTDQPVQHQVKCLVDFNEVQLGMGQRTVA